MTREEARTIVEALHRAVVTERPYASREVLVTRSPGVRHVSARWRSFYADEWDARAARVRALLETPADARQPSLFDLGGAR